MQNRNWPEYNKSLVQRGSLTFLITPKLLKPLHKKQKKNRLGRPVEFSDEMILILMVVKIHYRLTYRALEGFAKNTLCQLYPWMKVPTYSLICKKAASLKHRLPRLSSSRPETVLLDASGIKVVGEGEWKVKVHGRGRLRKWIKMHIGVDPKTQEVVAAITTASDVGDSAMTGELLRRSGKRVKRVIADGAYDGSKSRDAIKQLEAEALIPPPKNARLRNDMSDRDEALKAIKGLGGDKRAKSLWGKLSGYSIRALVETAFSRFKRLFGDRTFSKDFEKQEIEIGLKWYILNEMNRITA